MKLGARVHKHETKLKKDTNNDKFMPMQNPVTHKYHRSITSQFNVIEKHGQSSTNKVRTYYD